MTASPIIRSRISGAADPNALLSDLLGPGFAEYRRRWDQAEAGRRPDTPLHLDVDVTTACNFHCPMCPAGNSGHIFPRFQKGRYLNHDLYRQALAEASGFGLPSIRLGMTGEPLLIPDITDWVTEARAAGVLDVSLITNGRLLKPEMSRRLIAAGLTRLMISVDAGSPQVYAQTRPGGDWNLLLANIDAFLSLRREMKSLTPLLRISFVEMKANQGDRDRFRETFEPRADYLSFQRYLNILGDAETDFRPDDKAPESTRTGFCAEPLTRLALHADGGLFPCCSDFGRLRPLGNLETGGLLATWRSAEALDLTGPQARGLDPCRRCLAANQ